MDARRDIGALPAGRILWVDDEVDLLKPHLLLLRSSGYEVETTMNGLDAIELLDLYSYDLVLLDERMPGLRGLDVLGRIRRSAPLMPVVMVTKSEEDATMHEAIGRHVDDYIVKPTSPRQVLSVVTRLLAGSALRQEHITRDFSRQFGDLRARLLKAASWQEWAGLYSELIDWELALEEAGQTELREVLQGLMNELSRGFCDMVADRYGEWAHEGGEVGPPLSVDVLPRFFLPILDEDPAAMLVVMDCMRLGQWRAIMPIIHEHFEIEEALYAGLLPTATPFARNAIFGGLFPDELAEFRPEWWERGSEIGYNSFEDELFERHIRQLTGSRLPTHYEKIFSAKEGDAMLARLGGYLSSPSATALVFGFVDMLTHGRAKSHLIWEMARDTSALRSLTVTWFKRSPALKALRLAAKRGIRVLITTDHGSIHCRRPAVVYAQRDATKSLRYKLGSSLKAENPSAVLTATDPGEFRLPRKGFRQTAIICREDYFFVYPTNLRKYQRRYRDSFLHGGASPGEMVLPVALLTPR